MRIVKMVEWDLIDSNGLQLGTAIDDFFSKEIYKKDRYGLFYVRPRKIRKNGLQTGEYLIFTCDGVVRWKAQAASQLCQNVTGLYSATHPVYFKIDLVTLKKVTHPSWLKAPVLRLDDLRRQYSVSGGKPKNSWRGRAWISEPDPPMASFWSTF